MKTHKGSCHCGAVAYEVTQDFIDGMTCNCSRCKRLGAIWSYVDPSSFTLLKGKDELKEYHFNKHHIDHLFCTICGIESYAYGHDGNSNYMYAINLNCLEDFDTSTLAITAFDGVSL
jgi:hypothetical protein